MPCDTNDDDSLIDCEKVLTEITNLYVCLYYIDSKPSHLRGLSAEHRYYEI